MIIITFFQVCIHNTEASISEEQELFIMPMRKELKCHHLLLIICVLCIKFCINISEVIQQQISTRYHERKLLIGGSIHLTIANIYIARYLYEVNEWTLKIGKVGGHEENKHEEKIKKDQVYYQRIKLLGRWAGIN